MPSHWLDLEPEDDNANVPDDATEIAGEAPALVYARRIESVSNRLLFAEEVPMEHGVPFRDLDYIGTDGEPRHCEILRTEYKVPSDGKVPVRSGDQLHIAFRPYTTLLSLAVPFRGSKHRGKEERARCLDRPFASGENARAHAEGLRTDFWEQGKYLTAGFSAGPDRQGERSRSSWKRGYAVLGVCPRDIDGVRELLVSVCAQNLAEWTERGPFPFRPGTGLCLHPGAKEKAEHWLEWAAKQSLAGPIEHMDAPRGLPPGTPVERLMIRRYRNLLIYAHRDLTAARRSRDAGSGPVGNDRQVDWRTYRHWEEDEVNDDRFVSIEELEDELEDELGYSV